VCLHAGTITGDVKFVDSSPKLAPVKVTTDQDYCGETLPNESYLVDVNSGLKNVVVFVEAAPPAVPADPQKLNMIENTGCCYAPRIFAMQKGERLRVGFVHVFDHPFFAVTDDKGAFSIPNVPAGTYTLKAWHENA